MINSVKKSNSRPIEIDGIRYNSLTDASKILGIGLTTIAYRLDSDKFENYIRVLPKNDPSRYVAHTRTIPLEIDGVVYNGYKEASSKLNVSVGMIYNRMKSSKFPNYKRLK